MKNVIFKMNFLQPLLTTTMIFQHSWSLPEKNLSTWEYLIKKTKNMYNITFFCHGRKY